MTGILVPVADTSTLAQTVAAAAERATQLHLVRVVPAHHVDGVPATETSLIDRAEAAAREAGVESVDTAALGDDKYVAGPGEHCELLVSYADANGLDRLVLDPQYAADATDPTLQSVVSLLSDREIEVVLADVTSTTRLTAGELRRGGIVAVLAFGFYVALGGPTSTFALASGAVTGLIAAALLRNVAFEATPPFSRTLSIALRGLLFFPYLLWEIAKANVFFAYLVLHPSLPIDPRIDRVDAAVGSGLSVTTLANSITLTPGTLTLDASGHRLLVHSMTPGAQDDVLTGVHEKAVRFLFYGRAASELPGPRARDDYESIPTTTNGEGPPESAAEPTVESGGDTDE